MENKVGIWVDNEKSYIISLSSGIPSVRSIESHVERDRKASGGNRAVAPFAHQASSNEKQLLGRRTQEKKDFFREIIDDTRQASEIYIFGPAEAKKGLAKEMKKAPNMSDKIMAVETASKMSENQMVSHVRSFFKS